MEVAGRENVRFGDFEFDLRSGKLFREGRPVKIQPQPLRVLAVLLESAGETVSRESLRSRVWGDATFVEFDQGGADLDPLARLGAEPGDPTGLW